MLSGNEEASKVKTQANESEHIPCLSSIREVRGLDILKLTKFYPRGSVLFREGQRPPGVYILCEGRAKVSISSAEGKTLVLRIAEPGELLGINSVLADKPAGATVETLERCRIDFVTQDDFLRLLEHDKKAYPVVTRAFSEKLSSIMDLARLLLLSDSAAEKLARLLVRWCDGKGKRSSQGVRIHCGLTHAELAQLICTSRETVTRLLGDFQRMEMISINGDCIIIRNRKALGSVARN